jgi:hypothetical protein
MIAFLVLILFSKIGSNAADEHAVSIWQVTEAGVLGFISARFSHPKFAGSMSFETL